MCRGTPRLPDGSDRPYRGGCRKVPGTFPCVSMPVDNANHEDETNLLLSRKSDFQKIFLIKNLAG